MSFLKSQMAEILIGPLLTLSAYLGKWAWDKYRQTQRNQQHTRETDALLLAIEKLQELVNEKANAIKKLQFDIPVKSFRTLSYLERLLTVRHIEADY